jgi:hypothetical protein
MNNTESVKSDFEVLQEGIVQDIGQFSKEHPDIVEAMNVMNMSMADYIEAISSVRAARTFSCSASSHLPVHLPAEVGQ